MKKSIVKITFVQLLLLLIPITVNIYLLRIISLDVYGQFIFYQSVFNFLSILINSGLANDSLRDLSFHYGKEKFIIKLNEYISAKLFYLGLSIIFCLIMSLNNNFNNILFYVSFTYLFYFFFDFMILYQVMDKIGTNLNINLVSFLFTVCGLFLFVQNDSDIIYVPLIATIPFIIINFLVLSLILKKNSFFFKFNISLLICKIKNNLKIMVSNYN
ncbi:oligosaccharide flippase family protein [Malaciobacter mytili]|uniref:oligosaccharide flippase family protein n=1 Tax=Malaciobacter mytili TaxID=603050 RepID=UPI003A879865